MNPNEYMVNNSDQTAKERIEKQRVFMDKLARI